MERYERAI
ncbi:hypothetical protein V3C99_017847, partial [Haemonchus contortus]